jgi:hypothetical protein
LALDVVALVFGAAALTLDAVVLAFGAAALALDVVALVFEGAAAVFRTFSGDFLTTAFFPELLVRFCLVSAVFSVFFF